MKRSIVLSLVASACLLVLSVNEANARWRIFRRWGCGPGGCSPQQVRPAPTPNATDKPVKPRNPNAEPVAPIADR